MICQYCKRQLLKGEKCSCSGAVKARQAEEGGWLRNGEDIWNSENYKSDSNWSNGDDWSNKDGWESNYRSYDDASEGSSDSDDSVCNHNGTYYHEHSGWINSADVSSSSPRNSSYVYADVPKKKRSKPNLVLIIVVIIIISSALTTILPTIFLIGKDLLGKQTHTSDYDSDEEGPAYKDQTFTSSTDYIYETGEVYDDTYSNYWANILFDVPKHYEVASEEEYDSFETDDEDCAFCAYKDDGMGCIVIITSESDQLRYFETYLLHSTITANITAGINGAADADADSPICSAGEGFQYEIAGEAWLCSDLTSTYGDSSAHAVIATHRIDNGLIYMLVYENTKDRVYDFLDSITPIE